MSKELWLTHRDGSQTVNVDTGTNVTHSQEPGLVHANMDQLHNGWSKRSHSSSSPRAIRKRWGQRRALNFWLMFAVSCLSLFKIPWKNSKKLSGLLTLCGGTSVYFAFLFIYSSLRGKGIAKWMLTQVLFCTCALSNPTFSKGESDQEGPEMFLCPVHSIAESWGQDAIFALVILCFWSLRNSNVGFSSRSSFH